MDAQLEFALHPVEEEHARDVVGVECDRLVESSKTHGAISEPMGIRKQDSLGEQRVAFERV